VPVVGFVLVAGITGYWIVWDELAQYVAVGSAEWLAWLGLFGEPIARNFTTPQKLDDRFFTLLTFIHIVVPLLLLLLLWIHLLRITKPAINPNRGLAVGTFLMLLVLSLIKPAVSHGPANLTRMPAELAIDWFYLAPYQMVDIFSPGAVWGMVAVLSLILFALPWLPPRWKAEPAVVHLESCNGCARCFDDCPYDAIIMQPRSDGLPFEREATVNPDLCVACGICMGSCPTAMPFRRRSALVPGIELPDLTAMALRDKLNESAVEEVSGPRIAVIGCESTPFPDGQPGAGVSLIRLPCIAALPPSYIDFALSRGLADGVLIAGCPEGGCRYRFGPLWMEARIERRRDPYLRQRVPRERIRQVWLAAGERKYLEQALAEFSRDLTALNAAPSKPASDASKSEPQAEKVETHV
jgi:coenzyme F420-reducing hydrogenase delta subunit/ferredoxin